MKSKYETHVLPKLDLIQAWARDGVSDEQIARNLGIAYSTFRRYRDGHEALSAALAQGKDYVDQVVVTNAYLRRICGYDAIEVRREYAYVPDPLGGEPVRTLVKETEQTRHIPGDTRAAEFWLTNRQRALWRHKPEDAPDGDEDGKNMGVILMPEVTGDG